MAEPTTPNISLISPNTGDLPGAWGTAAINLNNLAIDGLLGGTQTITLSSATTFALTVATGAITPGAGPFQSQNACLFFSGTLTGNAVVQFTAPGRYVVHNKCTVGAFYVQLAPSAGTGNAVGAPPGQKATVFYDGTNMDYVDTMPVGAAFDLHGATAVPAWISACTVPPYLLKDGSLYSTATFPALGAMLGSTFGGNGVSTFGVPDERARARVALDTNTNGGVTNRLTLAISGVNGTTIGAFGGDQNMQTHSHAITDPGHFHNSNVDVGTGAANNGTLSGQITVPISITNNWNTGNAKTNITINNIGNGVAQNVQPTIVSFLPLIKT